MLVICLVFSGCVSPVADTAAQLNATPSTPSISGEQSPEVQSIATIPPPVIAKQTILYEGIDGFDVPIWAGDIRAFFTTRSFLTEVIFERSLSNYDFQTDVLHKQFLCSKDISPSNQEEAAYLYGGFQIPLILPDNGSYAITYEIRGNKLPEPLADIPINYGTDALTPGYGDYQKYLYIPVFSIGDHNLIKEYIYPFPYDENYLGPISIYGDYFPNHFRRDAVPSIIRNLLDPDMPDRNPGEKMGYTIIEPYQAWSPSGEYFIVWNADAFDNKEYLLHSLGENNREFYQYEVFTRDMTHLSTIVLPSTSTSPHDSVVLWEDGRNYIFPNETYLEYREYPIWNDGEGLLLHWRDDGSTTRRFTIDGQDITDAIHYGYFVKTLPDAPGQLWYREKDGSVRMVVENLCPPNTSSISFNPSLTICMWSAYSDEPYTSTGHNLFCGFTDLRGIVGNTP